MTTVERLSAPRRAEPLAPVGGHTMCRTGSRSPAPDEQMDAVNVNQMPG